MILDGTHGQLDCVGQPRAASVAIAQLASGFYPSFVAMSDDGYRRMSAYPSRREDEHAVGDVRRMLNLVCNEPAADHE